MIALFAQAAKKAAGYYPPPRRYGTEEHVTIVAIILGVAALVALVSFFLASIARALRKVSPEHRRMQPGEVWLNLIPVFNFVWLTATVERVAESLRAEFAARGADDPDEDYGRRAGFRLLVFLASGCLFYPIFVTYPAAVVQAIWYRGQMKRYAERLKDDYRLPRAKQIEDEGW